MSCCIDKTGSTIMSCDGFNIHPFSHWGIASEGKQESGFITVGSISLFHVPVLKLDHP